MPIVWLIEDNRAFRRATDRALRGNPEVQEPRAFENCEDALAAFESGARPDVILLDIGLPGMNGIEGIRRFKRLAPDVSIVLITVFEDDNRIFDAICAGASGYLLKSEPMPRVMQAIQDALAGGSPMNPRVARKVLEMFTRLNTNRKDYGLNEREQSVLELIVRGQAKKQIADQLNLNLHTVDYLIRCIYKKLYVNCVAAAVSLAVKDGLVQQGPELAERCFDAETKNQIALMPGNPSRLETKSLRLVARTRAEVFQDIADISPADRAQISPLWLARLEASSATDPWIHGFAIVHSASGVQVGQCGFKSPPDAQGVVEIAYGVAPEHQGKGYATEAAAALTAYAYADARVQLVIAHTLPEPNASTRVLTKCGFRRIGEVIDPEDGRVWRWEKSPGLYAIA